LSQAENIETQMIKTKNSNFFMGKVMIVNDWKHKVDSTLLINAKNIRQVGDNPAFPSSFVI
jgi:hypothetical protein